MLNLTGGADMNIKSRKALLIPLVLIFMLLASCKASPQITVDTALPNDVQNEPQTDTATDEIYSLGTILFEQSAITDVSVLLEQSFSGNICATASPEEREALLQVLYSADISKFEDADPSGIMAATVSLVLTDGNEEIILKIMNDGDSQYLVIINSALETQFKKGPADTFDFNTLHSLVENILSNETDTNYSGKVTIAGFDTPISINKGNSAYAKGLLDRAITEHGTTEADVDVSYDVEFTIGSAIYYINSETGHFFTEVDGVKIYVQLDNVTLMMLKPRLSISTL